VKENVLHKLLRTREREIPWWYHGLARGWPVVEVTEHAEPMVGWKGEHPQSVGWKQLEIDKYFSLCVV
jgi:hypothetical protein